MKTIEKIIQSFKTLKLSVAALMLAILFGAGTVQAQFVTPALTGIPTVATNLTTNIFLGPATSLTPLNGNQFLYVWVTYNAVTNTSAAGTPIVSCSGTPDGTTWLTRDTNYNVSLPLNGTNILTVVKKMDVKAFLQFRVNGFENSDTNNIAVSVKLSSQ